MVKSKASKAVCTAPSADVPPSIIEPPVVDPIVITSDEGTGNDNGDAVESMVVEDDELDAIAAEIAQNLWGVRFHISEGENMDLEPQPPSGIATINDFGVQEVTWRPSLTQLWMDVTDWTGEIGSSGTAAKEGVEGVRPDSTVQTYPRH